MSNHTYWLSLFNATTWQEFLDAGAEVSGFPESRMNTVRRIKPGDYLLGYLTGVSRWIAVLEVTSDPYEDLTRIWSQAIFPCRVKVKVVVSVPPDEGIPVLSISKDLQMFDDLKTPNWGLLFRTAPRELYPNDGKLIAESIRKATSGTLGSSENIG